MCVTWLTHVCDVTRLYVWCVSPMCETWLIYMWDDSSICVSRAALYWIFWNLINRVHCKVEIAILNVWRSDVWHDSFIRVTWLIHMCDMTHPLRLHPTPSTEVTWLFHTCVTWLIHMWRDLFTCVAWLIHMCDMTHPTCLHPTHSTKVTWLVHICDVTHSYVTWLIHMRDVTHSYVWHDSSFVSSPESLN